MKRNKKFYQRKEWLKLVREYNKLDKEINETELIKLDKPYPKGWVAYVKVSDKVKDIRMKYLYEKLIKYAFRSYQRDGDKYNYPITQIHIVKLIKNTDVKPEYNQIFQHAIPYPKLYTVDAFEHHVPNKYKKYFKHLNLKLESLNSKYYTKHFNSNTAYVINVPDYVYTVDLEPCMITHEKVLNNKAYSRSNILFDYIHKNAIYQKLYGKDNIYCEYYLDGYTPKDYKRNRNKKVIKRELDLYYEENDTNVQILQ